ncbi:MAG: DMT family transporter [Bdellovibrionales bacterium]|nr:DMT family transporter [Bdellovibrionales bacterium]
MVSARMTTQSTPPQTLPQSFRKVLPLAKSHGTEIMKGYFFVAITTLLWGIQPFFMKLALLQYSAMSVSWFRLTFAGIISWFLLSASKRTPLQAIRALPWSVWIAGFGLALNYYTFLEGVRHGGPAFAAVIIQVGPLALALIGVLYYQETLSKIQTVGVLLALSGFSLFYWDRLNTASSPESIPTALIFLLVGASLWVLYCIVQKELSRAHDSQVINLAVYGASGLFLVLFVAWQEFSRPFSLPSAAVVYLTFSTLVAYGCLAESLKRLPLSQVTCVIICNPFITLIGVEVCDALHIPWAIEGVISPFGYLGAGLALFGVSLAVVFKRASVKSHEN